MRDATYGRLLRLVGRYLHRWMTLEVRGSTLTALSGPLIIYANHLSIIDPVIIAMVMPDRIRFLAAGYLFRMPVLGRFLRWAGVWPLGGVSDTRRSLREAVSQVQEGGVVGLFPQGGVRKPGDPMTLESGLHHLWRLTRAPLVPIQLAGTDELVPVGRYWPRRAEVTVRIGEPITVPSECTRAEFERRTMIAFQSLEVESDSVPLNSRTSRSGS